MGFYGEERGKGLGREGGHLSALGRSTNSHSPEGYREPHPLVRTSVQQMPESSPCPSWLLTVIIWGVLKILPLWSHPVVSPSEFLINCVGG